jgi:hypothetical protein
MPTALVDTGRLSCCSASELSPHSSDPLPAGLGGAEVPKHNGSFDAARVDRGQAVMAVWVCKAGLQISTRGQGLGELV